EHPVGPRVIQRQDRLRAVCGDRGREPLMDDVERLRPRDALEAPLTFRTRPAYRRREPPLAVHEARIRLGHLRPQDTRRIGVRARALDRDDLLVLDGDGQAARVGAIERADTRVLGPHALPPSASAGGAPAPRRPAARTTFDPRASAGGAPAPRRPAARTTLCTR